MYKGKTILGIITARGGSKGLPKKNIKILHDKPLIAWSILPALKSKYIDYLMVSTDSQEICDISLEYGAKVPFLRPEEFAKDETSSVETVKNVLEMLNNIGKYYDYIFLIQPTSPFRKTKHIDTSIQMLIDNQEEFDALVTINELERPVHWNRNIKNSKLVPMIEYNKNKKYRRQDFEKTYRLNGMIYIIKTQTFLEQETFEPKNTMPYIVDNKSAIDIDTIEDFILASMYLKENVNEKIKI